MHRTYHQIQSKRVKEGKLAAGVCGKVLYDVEAARCENDSLARRVSTRVRGYGELLSSLTVPIQKPP